MVHQAITKKFRLFKSNLIIRRNKQLYLFCLFYSKETARAKKRRFRNASSIMTNTPESSISEELFQRAILARRVGDCSESVFWRLIKRKTVIAKLAMHDPTR